MTLHWRGTIEVAAPIEQVYDYLADFTRHHEWAQTVEPLELIQPGELSGVGAQYRSVPGPRASTGQPPHRKVAQRLQARPVVEVQERSRPRRIAWEARVAPRLGLRAEWAFDLTPHGEGQTTVTQTLVLHQPALFDWLWQRFGAVEKARAQWQQSLRQLKTVLEQPDAPPIAA